MQCFYDQFCSILDHGDLPQGQLILQAAFDFLADQYLTEIVQIILKNVQYSKLYQNLLELLTTKFDEKYWRHRFVKTCQTSYEYEHISGKENLNILEYVNLITIHKNIVTQKTQFLKITMDRGFHDSCFTVQQRGNHYFIGLVESYNIGKYGASWRYDLALYSVPRDPSWSSLSDHHFCTFDMWHKVDRHQFTPKSEDRSKQYHLAEPFLLKVIGNNIHAAFIPQLPLQFTQITFTDELYEFPRLDSGNFRNAKSRVIPVITKSGALLEVQLIHISFTSNVKMEVIWRCLVDQYGKTDLVKNSLRVNLTHVVFCTRVKLEEYEHAFVCRIPLSNSKKFAPKLEMVPYFKFSGENRARRYQSAIVDSYEIGDKFDIFIRGDDVYLRHHLASNICPPFIDMPTGYGTGYGRRQREGPTIVPKIYKVHFESKTFEIENSDQEIERQEDRVYIENRVFIYRAI